MRPRSLLFIATLITIVGSSFGCATAPPPHLKAPSAQTLSAEVVPPFIPSGQPVEPATTTSLELEQLLIFADARSPAIQTARARVGLAQAQVEQSKVYFPANPQLGVSVGGRSSGGATGLELEISAQQQLEVAGEQGLRQRAALDQQRLAKASVNEVRWAIHVEVHRVFVHLLLSRERVAQARRFIDFAQSTREIAAKQVEAGELSPVNLVVAEADLAQTRGALIQAQQEQLSLQAQLIALIGWPGSTLPPIKGQLPEVIAPPALPALLAAMAKHHPSLRAREIAVRASYSQLLLQQREAWPEPTVGLSYGREAAVGPGAGNPNHVWMLSLSVPLPTWQTNQGPRAQAAAEVSIAQRQRDEVATALRAQIIQAALAIDSAMQRVALYQGDIVPRHEQNLQSLKRAYELGEVDIHQVSQTRERLLNATAQYIDARIIYFDAVATLEGLIGAEVWGAQEPTP